MSIEKLKQHLTQEQFSDWKEVCLAFGLDVNDPAAVPLALGNRVLVNLSETLEAVRNQNRLLIEESAKSVEFSVTQASKAMLEVRENQIVAINEHINQRIVEAGNQARELVEKEIASAVSKAMDKAAEKATETLTTASSHALLRFDVSAGESAARLKSAAVAGDATADKLNKASKWLGGRALAGLFILPFALLATTYGISRAMLPDVDKANAEVAQANATLAKLNALGAKADFSTCTEKGKSRLCIRVDKSAGGFDKSEDYMVIKGY